MPPREAVKVAVRLRPMSSKEKEAGYSTIVDIDQANAGVSVTNPSNEKINFTFDFAFPPGISQEDVYEQTAAPIVSGVLEGFNGTIFAYGQTGTGKTYTMDGVEGNGRGIMSRAFEHIFDHITANQDDTQFLVTCQYVEIYNDELRDLLATHDSNEKLRIRENKDHTVYIQGVQNHKINCLDDLYRLLALGKKNRVVRKTNMNAESSRSHSILTLVVETMSQLEGGEHVRSARLNLVDLAGSERVAKTGAEGQGFKEGVNINYELMILGNCIAALTARGNQHIPYRDSKLTMLLRDSLGGNAKTVMIAALGPASYNFSETMSTLRYAERAKKIENKPTVNMDPKDALLLQYQEELKALQAQLNGDSIAQANSSENVIRMMEEKLAQQRKELAEQSRTLQQEHENLKKDLESCESNLQSEKEKHQKVQSRLEELKSYLAGGNQNLKARTEQNEAQIKAIKARLEERSKKAAALEKEVEKRRSRKEAAVSQLSTVQQQAEAVSGEFARLVAEYKNLKLMLPEIQKTIHEDREELAANISFLRKQKDLLQIIIDNFIPSSEVEKIKGAYEYNTQSGKWKSQALDKKAVLNKVIAVKRPQSAIGQLLPTASAKGYQTSLAQLNMKPAPIPSRLRSRSDFDESGLFQVRLEAALRAEEHDILCDAETCQMTTIPHRTSSMFE